MKKWRTAALLGLAATIPSLGACNTTGSSLATVEADCVSRYSTYSAAWGCARVQYAGTYDEYRARYLATGDDLLDQVNRGQISDAAARASMSGGFSRGGRR
jgi:hypothetical protein